MVGELDRAFAEGLLADHLPPPRILDSAGYNFTGAGAALIHQDNDREIKHRVVALGLKDLFLASLQLLDHDGAFLDEEATDIHRFGEKPTWIAPQVQNDGGNA